MTVHTARCLILHDRRDFNRPHLGYLPQRLYRHFRSVIRRN